MEAESRREAPDPHVLRATFDDSAESYDRARPVAPRQVFDDLIELGRLEPGARIVEIGSGTGQATLPLAERGFEIVGIELGEHLAEIARRKLAAFPKVTIVDSTFEDWDPAGERFDAVVAFNSFHWIDPEVRFAKPAEILVGGGTLAVVGMSFGEHDEADPVWLALQDEYETIAGMQEPRAHADRFNDRSAEFEASGLFHNVTVRHYSWDITFDADGYLAWLRTVSWLRSLDDDVRLRLFDRIASRIREQPRGTITPTMLAVLYVAERV